MLLAIIAAILGIVRAGDLQTSYQAVTCSVAIAMDDFINGNVTADGTFFVGIRTLYN